MSEIKRKDWAGFEKLIFKMLQDMFGFEESEQNHVTVEQSDGGYDGIFFLPSWIGSTNNVSHQYKVIFEAKLRSAVKNDLPLSDFSKSLIIAINIAANMIIIATNLHFSKNTVDVLHKYSLKTGLGIKLITANELMDWLHAGGETLNQDLLNGTQIQRLIQEAVSKSERHQDIPHYSQETLAPDDQLIGEVRRVQLQKALQAAKERTGILLVSGEAGVGKSVFSHNLIGGLEQTLDISTGIVDLQQCQTPRILFIHILEQLWEIPADVLLRMDSWEETIQWLGDGEISEDLKQAVLYAFRQADKAYEAQSSLFNNCLIEYLYRVQKLRQKKTAFCFSNTNYANQDLLAFFQQICVRFQTEALLIIELRELPAFESDQSDHLEKFSCNIRKLQKVRYECRLKPLSRDDARAYICLLLNNDTSCLEDDLLDRVIDDAGSNPLVLSAYINFVQSFVDLSHTSVLEFSRIQERLAYRENIIEQYIQSICKKDSKFTGLLAVLGMLNGVAPEDCLSRILEQDCVQQVEYLVQCYVCEFRGDHLAVRHSLYLHSLRQYQYIERTYQRKLATRLMEQLDHLVPDFQQATMIKIDLYQIRGEFQKAIIQSLEFIQELYDSGQYYLTYDYGVNTLGMLDQERSGPQTTLQVIRALMYVIQASFYIKGESVSKLQVRIDQARALMNLNRIRLKTDASYYILNCRLYLIENQYYHQSGKFTQAYETMKNALAFLREHKEYITDVELSGEIWLEYGIATKECFSLEQAITVLKDGIKDCPESKILQFTLNTHLYEQNCPFSVKDGQFFLEENAKLYKWLKPAEVFHNRVHVLNCQFLSREYDKVQSEGEELLRQTASRGLRNEEGRVCNILACLALVQGNLDSAHMYFDRGFRIFSENNYISNLWPLLLNCGTLLLREKDFSGATDCFSQTYKIFEENYLQRIHTLSFSKRNGFPRLLGGLFILWHNLRAILNIGRTAALTDMEQHLEDLCSKYISASEIETVLSGSNYSIDTWFLIGY